MHPVLLEVLARQRHRDLLRESKRAALKRQAETDKKQKTQTLRENVTKADLQTAQLME